MSFGFVSVGGAPKPLGRAGPLVGCCGFCACNKATVAGETWLSAASSRGSTFEVVCVCCVVVVVGALESVPEGPPTSEVVADVVVPEVDPASGMPRADAIVDAVLLGAAAVVVVPDVVDEDGAALVLVVVEVLVVCPVR